LVNSYSSFKTQNKKSANKVPHEAKTSAKWVTSRRQNVVLEKVNTDKHFIQREIVDPVWLMREYKPQVFKVKEAISFHVEMAQEAMLNNMDGFLHVRLGLDMTTKKKAKFMDNIKGAVCFPNFFKEGIQKEVIAICKKDEEIKAALEAGALFAGHSEVLKKFEKGEIAEQAYDFLVCTPETFPDVTLIKKKINKDKFPSIKTNTITENIGEAVARYHLSKDYESSKINDELGVLKAKIGTLNMGVEKLSENLSALVARVKQHKKYSNAFVLDLAVFAPPSTEKFLVDLSEYDSVAEADKEEAEEVEK